MQGCNGEDGAWEHTALAGSTSSSFHCLIESRQEPKVCCLEVLEGRVDLPNWLEEPAWLPLSEPVSHMEAHTGLYIEANRLLALLCCKPKLRQLVPLAFCCCCCCLCFHSLLHLPPPPIPNDIVIASGLRKRKRFATLQRHEKGEQTKKSSSKWAINTSPVPV